jgi:hypothetical protein
MMVLVLGVSGVFPPERPVRADKPTVVSPTVDCEDLDERFARCTLKPGTAIRVLLQTPLSTSHNRVGDPVEVIVTHSIYRLEQKLLSQSARIFGTVTRLEPAVEGRDGILDVRFTSLLPVNGEERLPLKAHVRTERPDHSWGGAVSPGSKPFLSVQKVLGIGEYNRIVYGGPRRMGKQIDIQPGEFWTLILDSPLTIIRGRPVEEGR